MKRYVIILVLVFIFGIGVDKIFFTNKKEEEPTEKNTQKKNTRSLSMMLETGSNTGGYETTTRSTWPTDGYLFNEELSKCENGGKLSWNDENNTVVMTGSTSDKCYVYFDKVVYLVDHIKSQYTGNQGSNGIYLHNSSLTNGAGDNSYRYAGANPNNYVCFGSDESVCPNDNLYRIIGVFGSQVKLIKWGYATSAQLGTNGDYYGIYSWGAEYYKGNNYTNIASYYWNYANMVNIDDPSQYNTWRFSQLNTINLNTNYITYLNNLDNKWVNEIAESTWKVGGNTWTNIGESPMNTAYQKELVTPATNTTYSAKIGLMYVSDYGYAASPTYWIYPGYSSSGTSSDYRAAVNNNWMYMGLQELTISRRSDDSDFAFRVFSNGQVRYGSVGYDVNYSAVRPCFYLNSNVTYSSGTGEKNSPIRIN